MPGRPVRGRTAAVAVTLAVLAVPALGGPATAAQAAGGTTTVLPVTVARSGITGVPAHLPGGEYTFRVSESGGGTLQLARLLGDYTAARLDRDLAAGFGKGDLKAVARVYANVVFEGGTGGQPHQTFTTFLTPGRYIYTDTNSSRPVTTFMVTEKGATAPDAPTVGPTVLGYEDPAHPDHFGFDVSGAFSQQGVLRFKAAGTDQPHFLAVAKLRKGATAHDCLMFSGPPGPDAPCALVLETGILSPGQAMVVPYRLTGPGRYLLACFLPDPSNGRLHAMLGMFTVVAVR